MKCIGTDHTVLIALLFFVGSIQAQVTKETLPQIRQVWLDGAQTSTVLGAGTWSIVPRDVFNNTLQRAEVVANARLRPPWLLSAQYEAVVTGLELNGSAELTLHNPHAIDTWARISPWSLPIKSTGMNSLDKVQALGERSLGIRVGSKKSEVAKLTWCTQGEERHDGRWFSLQLPSCAVASLQVTVPLPGRLDWPGNRQYLSGPFPVDGANARRWVLQLGGEARQDVLFVIREPAEQRMQSWTEARLDADFILGHSEVQVRYEIELQRWHDRLRTLTLDLPDEVQVKSVVLRQLGTDIPLNWQMTGIHALTVSLPESVEQRVTAVIDAVNPRKPGQRMRFELPRLRGVASTKPTIRVVTDPLQPMVNWNWGDFYPVQSPQKDRIQDSPAEVITLAPRMIKGTQGLQAPNAMQSLRTAEISYQQDTWWHLGRRRSQVIVRSQVTMPDGQPEILSWRVPDGWAVTQLTSDIPGAIRTWSWHPGQPLEAQLAKNTRPLKIVTVTIQLEPKHPATLTVEPVVVSLPTLQPALPGKYSGLYAVTLERLGVLQPPNLVVLKAPGAVTPWPESQATLWPTLISIVPDLCWRIQDASAQGSIRASEWPATVQAQLSTELQDNRIEYRIKLLPVAGVVSRFPIRFSSPVGDLNWQSLTARIPPAKWIANGEGGELVWPGDITTACELHAIRPWTSGTRIPLISSPLVPESTYHQGKTWLPPPGLSKTDHGGMGWRYDRTTESQIPVRRRTTYLTLIDPQITTHIEGDIAESEYVTGIEPHADPVTLQLQHKNQIVSMEVDGKALPLRDQVELPAAEQNTTVRIHYRSRVSTRLGFNVWQPSLPEWNVESSPPPIHRLLHDQSARDVWGISSKNGERADREVVQGTNIVIWISRQTLMALAVTFGVAAWWLVKAIKGQWMFIIIMVFCVCAWILLPEWWPLFLASAIGVIVAHGSVFIQVVRKHAAWALLLLMLLASTVILAQSERPAELVYLIPSEKGSHEPAQVMVNASLWKQLQSMAKLKEAGSHQNWWVSQVRTVGKLEGQQLRMSSSWMVTTNNDEVVELPLLLEQLPDAVRLDGQFVQTQLTFGPFGWRQFIIPIRKAGNHELQIEWVQPLGLTQREFISQIKLPGAPQQSLRFEEMPESVLLQGASVTKSEKKGQTSVLEAEAGFARNLTLSWPREGKEAVQATVDVGVLYEHRVHQSLAHAVLAYHIEKGILDEMMVDIPADWKVKQVSVVGELKASILPRLRRWRVSPLEESQRLQVLLQRPAAGTVHLLLEFMVPREQDTVPLSSIDTPGIHQNHHFVAYLTDGIAAHPLSALEPVAARELEFARTLIPSLASLPASSIGKSGQLKDSAVPLKLLPLSDKPVIKTRTEIVLNGEDSVLQQQLEVRDEQKPVVHLQGQVEPGLVIGDVTGDQVVRWHQNSPGGSEPTTLSIWFAPGNEGRALQCIITSRQPFELTDGQKTRVPVRRIKWEGVSENLLPLVIRNERAGSIEVLSETGLAPLRGPWQRDDTIASYRIRGNAGGTYFEVKESDLLSMPRAESRWINKSGELLWQLTLQPGKDGRLPSQIEMAVSNGQLEQNWQFEGNVALAIRPSREAQGSLQWHVQSRKPLSKLEMICHPLRDPSGKPQVPVVAFPAWPGLVVLDKGQVPQ